MIRLNRTYFLLLTYTSKFFFKIGSFGQNSSKLSKIRSIRLYTPRIAQDSHRLLTYLYYVSGTCPSREPCGIAANYANSTQFAHTVRESSEIRTICQHSTLRFRCLTSGRECHKIPANQTKFAQFAHIFRELRELCTKINPYLVNLQISAHRQRTQENWSESTRFRSICPPITRITRTPCILQ